MNASAVQPSLHGQVSTSVPAFEFRGEDTFLRAGPEARALPRGTADTLAGRLAAAFDGAPEGGVVAGAMPFCRDEDDALWLAPPARAAGAATAVTPTTGWTLREDPSGADYAAAVTRALEMIGEDPADGCGLKKVVLARSLLARAPQPIDLPAVLNRLATDPAAMAFLLRLPSDGAPRHLIGATPELLLRKTGPRIFSHPLAGSARRLDDAAADRAAAEHLSTSAKDRHEHRFVVDFILDTLTPLCRTLACPRGTGLTSTSSMWHLGTGIEGVLRDPDIPSAVLAAALHPTPAVCGTPQGRAAAAIAELEPVARGFYAGAVGWTDRAGDGAWHVAIRCAEVSGAEARLFAGAGIVAGSDPQAERAETGAKFAALLSGLGLDGAAALQGE
ncbi:MAG: isochorismate synthase [Paracoccaceae bacterium]